MKALQDNEHRQKEHPYRQSLRSFRRRLMMAGFLIVALFVLLILQNRYLPENRPLNFLIGASLIASLIFVISQFARETKFVDILLEAEDLTLPLVLDSLGKGTTASKKEVTANGEVFWTSLPVSSQESACLRRLLPQMDREATDRLTAEQAQNLYRLLKKELIEDEVRVLLSILDSLLITEDTRALPYLQSLAEEMGSASNGQKNQSPQFHRVRKLVQSCLPVLTARFERERSEQTLLRAGIRPEVSAGELVRPTLPTNADNTSDLLHPIEKVPLEGKRDS